MATETRKGIQCGNCKQKHDTVAEVRDCYAVGEEVQPATGPQINYAQMLFRKRIPLPAEERDDPDMVHQAIEKMSKREISDFIQRYKDQPEKPRFAATVVDLADGIYTNAEGDIIKIYWNLGKSRLLTKRLEVTDVREWGDARPTRKDGSPKDYDAEWRYIGAAMADHVQGFHRITPEEAQRFGELYSICSICGRDINDEKSVERGVGRVCWSKIQGWSE